MLAVVTSNGRRQMPDCLSQSTLHPLRTITLLTPSYWHSTLGPRISKTISHKSGAQTWAPDMPRFEIAQSRDNIGASYADRGQCLPSQTPEPEHAGIGSVTVKKQSLVQAGGTITVAFSFLVGCPLEETITES